MPAMQEHLKIIRAVKRRDPEVAATAIGDHLTTLMMKALGA